MTGTSKYHFGRPTYHRILLLLRRLQIRTTYYSYYLRPTTSIYYFLPTTLEAVNATATAVTMSIAITAPVAHIMKMSALRIAANQNNCLQFVNWPYIENAALVVCAHLASNSSSGLTLELLHASSPHTCLTSCRSMNATRGNRRTCTAKLVERPRNHHNSRIHHGRLGYGCASTWINITSYRHVCAAYCMSRPPPP